MSSSNDDDIDEYNETKDDVGADRTEFSCALHQVYVDSGNQKKVLFLLCLGLSLSDTNDAPLLSFETEPWSRLPKTLTSQRKFCDDQGYFEYILHHDLSTGPSCRRLNCLRLIQCKIVLIFCFLRGKVICIKEILERSLAEEQQQRELLGLGGIGVCRGGN